MQTATRTSINPYALAVGVAATVALTKLVSYLTPYKLYFSFTSFLYNARSVFRWEALALKLLIPCLVGFLLFAVPYQWMRLTGGSVTNFRSIYRYLAGQALLTAQTVGFASALLLAWPFLVYWDVLMDPVLYSMRLPYLFVYLLYFIAYAYFAGLGVALARLLVRQELPERSTAGDARRLAWLEAVRTSTLGLVTSAIATYFASRLGGA